MPKPKGTPKTGGRQKGTPNKATSLCRDTVNRLLCHYQDTGKMSADFDQLEPKERLSIAEKLMAYVMPKYQSVALDLGESATVQTVESRLIQLSQTPSEP